MTISSPGRRAAALLTAIGLLCASSACSRPQAPAAEAQEAAFRANNRGVALLEQFSYGPAVDAFREALKESPSLRLARINLPIALFYAGMNKEAADEASTATRSYPDAPQPLFILGLSARVDNRLDDAADAFRKVLRLDPDDVGSKVNLALIAMQQRRYAEAVELAQSALALEPFNATAAYNLGLALTRTGNSPAAGDAMRRFDEIRAAGAAVTYSQTYLEQGRYAEALTSTGAENELVSTTSPAVQFVDATAAMLGPAAPGTGNRDDTPVPLAGCVTLADIDDDGDLDLVIGGPSGLRLLRNDRTRFVDVTRESGLAATGVTGVAVGDFNNDSLPDVLALTRNGPRLFAQIEGHIFHEVNLGRAAAAAPRTARAAALVDVDHDGDLDILIGGFVDPSPSVSSETSPFGMLRSGRPTGGRLLRNDGNGAFSDVTGAAGLDGASAVVAVAPTDFDNHRDVDLLMLSYGARPRLFRNNRTGSFEDVAAAVGFPDAGPYTALAVGDVNKDGFTDAFFGQESAAGVWAVSDGRGRFRLDAAPAETRGAVAAQLFDYDNDGLLDLFVATSEGPRLLRNLGGRWQDESGRAFAKDVQEAGRAVAAIAVGDLDLDGDSDVVVLLRSGDVRIWRNEGGNTNRSLRVRLAGRVSNRSGVGSKIEMRAGSLHQKLETSSATPQTSPADVVFGLGRRSAADVVRVIWPAGIVQAETETARATADPAGLAIVELNRKPSSCPFLFTWNGSRFQFVTDFMGAGEMGSWEGPHERNTPHPVEYVKISDGQLRARDGRLDLRITNELEEVLFLDQVELLAVAHPDDVEVFPDAGLRERATPFRVFATRNARAPLAAHDEHGHDLLPALARLDRHYVDDFSLTPIRGYADRHTITLDVGMTSSGSAPRPGSSRTVLLLTGWTDYAFSSDNVAANQSGLRLAPPALEIQDQSGRWRTVDPDIGFPIGRPQTLVVDITRFAGRPLRIVTNMRIYWDQLQVADAIDVPAAPVALPLRSATLRWRGFSAEVAPDGREPFGYDYDRVRFDAPWKTMTGRYTRLGDVAELIGRADDRFVVSKPGDEVMLSFDGATAGNPLQRGRYTFLLHSVGYSKEMNLHSASPDTVAPMPFRAMSRYPYPAEERYPHHDDFDRLHTRAVLRSIPLLAGAESAPPSGASESRAR